MDHSFGIKLPGLVPAYAPTLCDLPALVAEFERMGYDDVSDGEHLLFAPGMVQPGGGGDLVHGRSEQLSDRGDPLIMFTAIAMRTSRIRLVSNVLLPAAHGFGALARQASTLDLLSSGRFVLGVGGSWCGGEFAAHGIAPAERNARTEETIRACQTLWQPGLASFHGRWINFDGMVSEPAPITRGGPPVWWGGNALTGATARRVVEFCSGWIAREAAGYDEIAQSIEHIRSAADVAGRDPSTIGFRVSALPTAPSPWWQSVPELFDHLIGNCGRLAALGVTHFNLPLNFLRLRLADVELLLKELRTA
jgi:probable F420-dependent oxidoreductase